ncbi:ROK family protein [Streptomyces sp. S465]|uniref:ROK family protein n=1 Tax=Streptomyces sp. S465 TaxID=2979468 RepID=UPI0022A868CE|nr:ROK family protein [Streptomyces sp. S465]WAP54000.1 ROK family protein [Streptomyces sp. S465]
MTGRAAGDAADRARTGADRPGPRTTPAHRPSATASAAPSVGVDLGGTGARLVAWQDGTVLAAADALSADLGTGEVPERVDRLARVISGLLPTGVRPAAVGIGASGPVDVTAGVVHNHDTLPWFSGFPLTETLGARLSVPVVIDNDAVTAALGEHAAGAGQGCDRMLMVTLGTGIGTAMLVDGHPVRGLDGNHPEGGHLPVTDDPARCYCGLTGCWEQAASRSALQRMLAARLGDGPPGRRTLEQGVRAARTDPAVREVFTAYGTLLGRGLAALHALYQPRVTVLGGSAATCLPLFAEGMRRALRRSPEYDVPTDIRPARLGDNAGAVGAAILTHRVPPAGG